jgi:hypothetical protein
MLDDYLGWLRSLDEAELVDVRFELYDVAEIAGRGSELYVFAEMALKAIGTLERQRAARRELREVCAFAMPDLDADDFADAVTAIFRAQKQLGAVDVVEAFRGAIEVAERRAQDNTTRKAAHDN